MELLCQVYGGSVPSSEEATREISKESHFVLIAIDGRGKFFRAFSSSPKDGHPLTGPKENDVKVDETPRLEKGFSLFLSLRGKQTRNYGVTKADGGREESV